MTINELSFSIIGAAMKVHTELGPGLLESVYEKALEYQLRLSGHTVQTQLGVPMSYNDNDFPVGFKIDLLVDDMVVVEIKSVAKIQDVHYKQLLTYLVLSDKRLGLLINFNSAHLRDAITRIANKL